MVTTNNPDAIGPSASHHDAIEPLSLPQDAIELVTPAILPTHDVEMCPVTSQDRKKSDTSPYLVTFNPVFDPDNPKDWPTGKKWAVTDVLSATGFNRIMVSTIMAPCLGSIAADLHMSSTESVMALSIYLLATAFGPLVMGPLSEVYGRSAVLHASGLWFFVWNLACGFASTKGVLIASRFLAGFGASSIYALAGGVLGDIWRPEQRGTSLGMYLLIPLVGAAVGPIIGGFISYHTTWRWAFWSTSAFQAAMMVVALTTFKETYGPQILRLKARRLRKETGNDLYHTAEEATSGRRSVSKVLRKALTRPIRLLLFHPIIQLAALLSAFEYGLLYIVLATFSDLWTSRYHQSVQISGLHYIAIAAGEISGSQLGGKVIDYLYRRQAASRAGQEIRPEARIPLMFPTLVIIPAGLLLYGWFAERLLPWPAVDAAVVLLLFGMQTVGMPMQAYVIDVYGEHTSSALAAMQFYNSLGAFGLPLFAPAMYKTLGYGWGNTLLAGLVVTLGMLGPFTIWRFGQGMRAKARSSY